NTLYFMQQGRVRATRPGQAPWTFEGRWFLGGFEGHQDRPASRTLVALDDFHALKIPRRPWLDLVEDSFELTRLSVVASSPAVAGLDARILTLEKNRPHMKVRGDVDRPLSAVERIAFLAELRMARGAGVQALADQASASDELTLRDGEALFDGRQGRDHFFVV